MINQRALHVMSLLSEVECGLKMSVLMPDIIGICFTQPASVDLATALCDFMKLANN